ncbi:MAG: GAF domain-containing protein [Bacteroidota bacterium]
MAETIFIDKNLSDGKIYESILPQIDSLLNAEEPLISSLSNVTAALKEAFEKISWVGFYISKGDKLFLGPFQGKVACTVINVGNGVCGTAALKKETIIVEDVDKFPGHIACDSGSKSEIVVPLIVNGKVIGVLDLDSYQYSAFNNTDKKYLEMLCFILVNRLKLEKAIQLLI